MTDPFLFSASDSEPAPAAPSAARNDELALRSGIPRAILDIAPAEVVENFVTRAERWAELVADLRQALEAAGFGQHDPRGAGGGFHIAAHLRDDGVLVSWSARQDTPSESGPFGNAIEAIMQPALQAILVTCGFAAQMIPKDHDDAGCILVTGRTAPPA